MHGHVGAAALVGHGHADIGCGQRGGVVDPVANHHHGVPLGLELADVAGFVAGQHVADDFIGLQSHLFGHGQGGTAVVAREHHHPQAARSQRGQCRAGTGFGRIAKGQHGQGLEPRRGLLRQQRQRMASVLQPVNVLSQVTQRQVQLNHPAQAAQHVVATVHIAAQAFARCGLQLGHGRPADVLRCGVQHHSACQWVAAAALQRSRHAHHAGGIGACHGNHLGQPGLPHGERAGFVKHHHVGLVCQLQRLRVFDQNAVLRRHPGAGHDGGRCGQTQCAGAGNHQHGDGVDDGQLKRQPVCQPAQQRQQRQPQHHRHKHRADLVDQALNGCLGGLRVFHQRNDARQHGVDPGGLDLNHHPAVAIERAPGDLVLHGFGHRQGFAGQHRLIDLGVAFQHHAIDGKALAGAHHQFITRQHFVNRHIHFAVKPQQVRGVRTQCMQRANG